MTRDRGKRVERVSHTEDTLVEVYFGLAAAGVTGQQAIDAVNQMQNRGILFRVRDETPDRFAGIPDEAVRKESNFVKVNVSSPWDLNELSTEIHSGERVKATILDSKTGKRVDISDEYNTWIDTLPIEHKISFVWTEER